MLTSQSHYTLQQIMDCTQQAPKPSSDIVLHLLRLLLVAFQATFTVRRPRPVPRFGTPETCTRNFKFAPNYDCCVLFAASFWHKKLESVSLTPLTLLGQVGRWLSSARPTRTKFHRNENHFVLMGLESSTIDTFRSTGNTR